MLDACAVIVQQPREGVRNDLTCEQLPSREDDAGPEEETPVSPRRSQFVASSGSQICALSGYMPSRDLSGLTAQSFARTLMANSCPSPDSPPAPHESETIHSETPIRHAKKFALAFDKAAHINSALGLIFLFVKIKPSDSRQQQPPALYKYLIIIHAQNTCCMRAALKQ